MIDNDFDIGIAMTNDINNNINTHPKAPSLKGHLNGPPPSRLPPPRVPSSRAPSRAPSLKGSLKDSLKDL